MPSLLVLPNELLFEIASYLPDGDAVHLKNVNHRLYDLLDEFVYTRDKETLISAAIYGIQFDDTFMVKKALDSGLDLTLENLPPKFAGLRLTDVAVICESLSSLALLLENGAKSSPIAMVLHNHRNFHYERRSKGEPHPGIGPNVIKFAACFTMLVESGVDLNDYSYIDPDSLFDEDSIDPQTVNISPHSLPEMVDLEQAGSRHLSVPGAGWHELRGIR